MLADKALVSVQAVSALERGYRRVPYPKTLERLADALVLPAEARAALDESAKRARGLRSREHAEVPTHNLPRQLTSLLGRDFVVREIRGLVSSAPMVSVVGTGGVGKTRVAIEVARQSLAQLPDGAWFVELAPLNDPQLVTHALAETLGIQESDRTPLLASLIGHLSQKHALIVLDNCEHVIDQTRRVLGSIVRECPKITFLITSREALNVAGERVYRLPSLAVPEHSTIAPEDALKFGAVALFAERVRAADAGFGVTRENLAPIIEICRRLDGLPLAIELAAARATVLSPQQIVDRLDRIFDLLIPDGQNTIARHKTMRAVVEWSYALLSSQMRLLFDRLAIFASSFSLETATTVCADSMLANEDVLELLSSLISRSMIMVDFSRGEARYQMLEATRQYALEKLAERGERDEISQRYALSCLLVAQRLDRDWYATDERAWFQDAAAELNNCRAALHWSLVEKRDVNIGSLIAAALARVWYSLALVEGRNWVRLALSLVDSEEFLGTVNQLNLAEAELCGALGEYAGSFTAAERVLNTRDVDEMDLARAQQAAGTALGGLGRTAEAEVLLRKALDSARRLDNRRLQALALSDLGTLRSRCGDVDDARLFYAEAITYYIALNLQRPAASVAGNLAEIEFAAGDVGAALQRAEEALAGHEAWGNRRSAANDLCNMAAYLVAMDCFDDARTHGVNALNAAKDVKATVLTAYILQHFAAIGALDRYAESNYEKANRERAAVLLGYVDFRLTALQVKREYTEQQEYDRIVVSLRGILRQKLDSVMRLGADWTEDEATKVALEL
jgi:predicted ATPase